MINNTEAPKAETAKELYILETVPEGTKLYGFAHMCAAISDPDNNLTGVTEEAIAKFGVTEKKAAIVTLSDKIYDAAVRLAEVRRSSGLVDNEDILVSTSRELRGLMGTWYTMCGTRPPVMKPNKAYNPDVDRRPLYKVTDSELVIIGECSEAARAAAGGNIAKISEEFLNRLVINTGRILNGKPMGTVSAEDLEAAKKAANAEKSEKAAKTRKKNTAKAKEQEDLREKCEGLEKQLAEMKASAIKTKPIVDALVASHATYAEKAAILRLLGEEALAAEFEVKAEKKSAAKAEPKIRPVKHKQAA